MYKPTLWVGIYFEISMCQPMYCVVLFSYCTIVSFCGEPDVLQYIRIPTYATVAIKNITSCMNDDAVSVSSAHVQNTPNRHKPIIATNIKAIVDSNIYNRNVLLRRSCKFSFHIGIAYITHQKTCAYVGATPQVYCRLFDD